MNILALETSGAYCSVAILCAGAVPQMLVDESQLSHSEKILGMIESVLSSAALHQSKIDCVAVCCGPGSFTGLRIGMAVAQGMAFGLDIPVVPVSSLAAVAFAAAKSIDRAEESVGSRPVVLATLDARMNQLYAGWYSLNEELPKLLGDERVIDASNIKKTIPEGLSGHYCIAGSGMIYQTELLEQLKRLPLQRLALNSMSHQQQAQLQSDDGVDKFYASICPKADAIARLAAVDYARQRWVDAEQLSPSYLRNDVAY